MEWADDPWADVASAGDWLLGLEARLRPDVVHLNGHVHAALPWRRRPVVVAHSCDLSWWWEVKGEPAPPRYARYRAAVAAGMRAAAVVVAPTRATLGALARHYGFRPGGSGLADALDAAPGGGRRLMAPLGLLLSALFLLAVLSGGPASAILPPCAVQKPPGAPRCASSPGSGSARPARRRLWAPGASLVSHDGVAPQSRGRLPPAESVGPRQPLLRSAGW